MAWYDNIKPYQLLNPANIIAGSLGSKADPENKAGAAVTSAINVGTAPTRVLLGGIPAVPSRSSPAAQAIPTGNAAYEGFDDQYTSFATANAAEKARQAVAGPRAAAATAALRGTNPTFDNAYMDKYYKDVQVNGYDPKVAQGLPGMNPATGIGGSGIGAALQGAAARGDWDAVNRYYASQGQSFAGMAPPKQRGQMALEDMLTAPGIKNSKKMDRIATMLNAERRDQTLMDISARQGENALALQQAKQASPLEQSQVNYYGARAKAAELGPAFKASADEIENLMAKRHPEAKGGKPLTQDQLNIVDLEIAKAKAAQHNLFQQYGYADGGLVGGGPAPGRAMQPMVNPMGSFGMPSSMQSLDPVIRQYGQYVSAATQYGLQPLPFTKFIDVMASARQQMQQLPTQGGVTPFADGGYVENDSMYADGGLVDNRSWLAKLFGAAPSPPQPSAPSQMAGRGAALLGQGMAGQAGQAIQGRNAALEAALREAQGARMGYADGGAIPVAGRQVLGPGGPTSDSIPAVVDGERPAALSSGEYVLPTEAVKFYGTDKLDKMVAKAKGIK